MPPRKAAKRGKQPRQPTQFGVLETTPTSRAPKPASQLHPSGSAGLQLDASVDKRVSASRKTLQPPDEYEDGLDDMDLVPFYEMEESDSRPTRLASCMEDENAAQRSSPAIDFGTPENLWRFDDGSAFSCSSSYKSGDDNLPNTMPLPPDPMINPEPDLEEDAQMRKRVDFSETVSTNLRSTPFSQANHDADNIWDFEDRSSVQPTVTKIGGPNQQQARSSPSHLSMNELYDATPQKKPKKKNASVSSSQPVPKTRLQDAPKVYTSKHHNTQPVAAPKGPPENLESSQKRGLKKMLESELGTDGEEEVETPQLPPQKKPKITPQSFELPSSEDAAEEQEKSTKSCSSKKVGANAPTCQDVQRGRKRKQRAKTPIQFDDTTQRVKDVSGRKKPSPPSRMPIVSALIDSAQSSSSPAFQKKKPPANPSKAKKQPRKAPAKGVRKARTSAKKVVDTSLDQPKPAQVLGQVAGDVKADVRKPTLANGGKGSEKSNIGKTPVQPIEVGSDSDNSSYLPQSSTSPPDPCLTMDTTVELASGRVQQQDPPSTPKAESKSRSEPQLAPVNSKTRSNADHRESRSKLQKVVKAKTTTKAKEKSSLKPDSQSYGGDPRPALATLDSNVLGRRISRREEKSHLKAANVAKQPDVTPVRTPTKNIRAPRNFSISQAGSPLPIDSEKNPLTDHSMSEELESYKLVNDAASRRLRYELTDPPSSGDVFVTEAFGVSSSAIQHDQAKRLASTRARGRGPNEAASKQSNGLMSSTQVSQTLRPHMAAINEQVRDQLLAALQIHDTESGGGGQKAQNRANAQRGGHDAIQLGSQYANGMTEQLHKIVDNITNHLESKEGTVHRAAGAYRKNGLRCVEKIGQRFGPEREALAGTLKKDADSFIRILHKATDTVEGNQSKEGVILRNTTETLAARRVLYQRATTNLRALHGRLLGPPM